MKIIQIAILWILYASSTKITYYLLTNLISKLDKMLVKIKYKYLHSENGLVWPLIAGLAELMLDCRSLFISNVSQSLASNPNNLWVCLSAG